LFNSAVTIYSSSYFVFTAVFASSNHSILRKTPRNSEVAYTGNSYNDITTRGAEEISPTTAMFSRSFTFAKWREHLRWRLNSLKAKFHYAIWSQRGPKLVADLPRARIWPIIFLASSELARASRYATSLGPVCDQDSVMEFDFEPTCRDSSNLLEPGRRPVRSQIPLRYLIADRSEAGRRPVADLLACASLLLASSMIGQIPARCRSATSFGPVCDQLA